MTLTFYLLGATVIIDTLNEALKIAAMDIAEVAEADDDLLSDDDAIDEQESVLTSSLHSKSHASRTEVDDEGFSDAPGSRRDKALNRASMLREAKKDNASLGGASSGSRGGRSGVTFVVQPNGNYEQK